MMTDIQTKARAIYERGINAGQQYSVVNEIATALAEKDAELAAQLAETQRAWNERDGEKRRRLLAEAALAEARKALEALDRMNRGVDWCDHDEQARRWDAARRALEAQGGENNG